MSVTDEEAIRFLQTMGSAANGIPLVLYNPPHAKRVLAPSDYPILTAAVPQLTGIKVADGDAGWYAQMRSCAASLSVFVPGHHLATGVKEKVGAGAYSNVACINPAFAQAWWQMMHSDLEGAMAIEQRIRHFFAEAIMPYKKAGYSNPALDKLLAAVGAWANIGTRLRWPYRWIPEADAAPVRKLARKYIPEFLEINSTWLK